MQCHRGACVDSGANRIVRTTQNNSWSKKRGEAVQLELIGWENASNHGGLVVMMFGFSGPQLTWAVSTVDVGRFERTRFCFLIALTSFAGSFSMTSAVEFDSAMLTSIAANHNEADVPGSAAVEPET